MCRGRCSTRPQTPPARKEISIEAVFHGAYLAILVTHGYCSDARLTRGQARAKDQNVQTLHSVYQVLLGCDTDSEVPAKHLHSSSRRRPKHHKSGFAY